AGGVGPVHFRCALRGKLGDVESAAIGTDPDLPQGPGRGGTCAAADAITSADYVLDRRRTRRTSARGRSADPGRSSGRLRRVLHRNLAWKRCELASRYRRSVTAPLRLDCRNVTGTVRGG